MDNLGIIFVAIGAFLLAFGRIAQLLIRRSVDNKIEKKEEQANEAAKNSADALSLYRELKRRRDNSDV